MQDSKKVSVTKKTEICDTFILAGLQWKILDITDKGYLCLAGKLGLMEFDSSHNDWSKSDRREYLNGKFYNKIAAKVGKENIVPFEK